jgi:hypothetical protein
MSQTQFVLLLYSDVIWDADDHKFPLNASNVYLPDSNQEYFCFAVFLIETCPFVSTA